MNKRKTRLGLVLATVAFASLAFSQPARAADYTGDCANIPDHVTGDAVVSDSACVIDTGATLIVDGTLTINAVSVDVKSEIQAVSKVTIRTTTGELKLRRKASSQFSDILLQAPQNRIETKVLEAGNSVQVDAGLNGAEGSIRDIVIDGRIVVNKHQPFPSPDIHANVLLRASGPISTKTIRTDGALGATNIKSGGIQIEAYRTIALAEGAGEFVIGGPGVNGVDGELITRSSVGGGTNSVTTIGGVNIVNGNRFSQGSIRLVNVSAIKINATQSRSGFLELNAQAGKIFLPEGRLDSDSAPGQRAGIVLLLAKTLDVQPGTIISASQAQDDPGSSHQVVIAVETVKFRGGEAGGLKVLADGHGVPGYFGLVQLVPYGYLTPVNTTDQHNNVNQMFWTYTVNTPELAKDGPLTLDGTEGNAPLLLRADGNTAAVNVSGYPLTFNGGDVTIRSRGQTLHRINVGFFGSRTNKQGLLVNVIGNFIIDANGVNGSGGIVQVKADSTVFAASPDVTDESSGLIAIRADGPSQGSGDGGTINLDISEVDLLARAVISASGATSSTGNAVKSALGGTGPQAVIFTSGSSVSLGSGYGKFRILAKGGFAGGNGGGVVVLTSGASQINVANSLAVDVSAPGSVGDGGNIELNSPSRVQFKDGADFADTNLALVANGGTFTGAGGQVLLPHVRGPYDSASTRHLNVNAIIKVDGGPSSPTSVFDGSIKIRGVTCRQYKTGFATWPRRYWNCVNPDSPGAETIVPQTAFGIYPDIHKAELEIHSVQIYVMQNSNAWSDFFADTVQRSTSELGLSRLTSPPKRESTSTVFMATNDGVTNNTLVATTAHELGHQLDFFWGSVSQLTTWGTAYNNDFSKTSPGYINGEACTTVFLPATCSDPDYAGMTNSNIFFAKYGVSSTTKSEMFAEMFEHVQTNAGSQEFSNALEYLPEMKQYMQEAVNNNNHP